MSPQLKWTQSHRSGRGFAPSTYYNKRGIALLITLFFIIAITVAVGLSLTQLQTGQIQLKESRFHLQSSVVVEDVLSLLEASLKITPIEDAESFSAFLDSTALIPFEAEELRVKIAIESARGKINLNTLAGSKTFKNRLDEFLLRYNIQNSSYLMDLISDCMGGKKEVYLTDLFDERPWFYREKIAGKRHLEQIVDYYVLTQHDKSVRDVPWNRVFRFGDNNSSGIDANYASAEAWQLMLPEISSEKAQSLATGGIMKYEKEADLGLSGEELEQISAFDVAYYLPRVHVEVTIEEHNSSAEISFEYDVNTKKAKEFTYGI
ncbi:MAG: hypothetical protein U9Q62_07395 [Campylobacterota bacterium]|nr:hypothetical protein [Campylobacterota bacterium]